MSLITQKTITLPQWLDELKIKSSYPADKEKARLAVALASLNIKHGTGGPFGAAVFDDVTGGLISMGVNIVIDSNCSVNHAEIMAVMMAQEKLKQYRLNLDDKRYTLATSAQPCAMCFGALLWSGLSKLIVSASRNDVISLTEFDEGPTPPDWISECKSRGIDVVQGILQNEACDVLKSYRESEGTIY